MKRFIVTRETMAAKMYLTRDADLSPKWTNDRARAWEMDEAGAIFLANIKVGVAEDAQTGESLDMWHLSS